MKQVILDWTSRYNSHTEGNIIILKSQYQDKISAVWAILLLFLGWKYKSRIYPLTGQYCDNLQSEHRLVPEHIPRPDYADHPQGFPLSEQKLKGNTYMRQLDADEIDGEEGEVVLLQLQ